MLPVVEGGRVPSSNTYNADDVVASYLSGAEELIDAESAKNIIITPADNYAVPSITKKNAEIVQIVKEEMELILIGNKTIEEGLSSAKERSDALLSE
jgi:multiple sugar transport system substrate-binding protein